MYMINAWHRRQSIGESNRRAAVCAASAIAADIVTFATYSSRTRRAARRGGEKSSSKSDAALLLLHAFSASILILRSLVRCHDALRFALSLRVRTALLPRALLPFAPHLCCTRTFRVLMFTAPRLRLGLWLIMRSRPPAPRSAPACCAHHLPLLPASSIAV
jgi:hypothetical protein